MDINKQDDLNQKYRSRLVAKEVNRSPKATPPLECLRMVMSSVMDLVAARAGEVDHVRLLICDVSRAYLYAPAIRPVHVKIVDEDYEPGGEGKCERSNASMLGKRDAALNWYEHCKKRLGSLGFVQGRIGCGTSIAGNSPMNWPTILIG